MRDEHPDLARLGRMVDAALGDVRRTESVGPALLCGAVVGSLPLLLLLVHLLIHVLPGG